MTQPGSIIPPQPGWWVRSGRSGAATSIYGWECLPVGRVPLVYGAKRSIIIPNSNKLTYPILTPLRQAMQGGKILTRPRSDEYGDPGIGAQTKIYIPNPGGRTYPLLRPFRLGSPILRTSIVAVTFDSAGAGTTGFVTSWSENHTITGSAVVLGIHAAVSSGTVPVFTASVGSTSMTQLGSTYQYLVSGSWFYLLLFGLLTPPTGVQTISVTCSEGVQAAMDTISFSGASSFGTVVTTNGTGTSLSQSVTAPSGKMIFQMFGCNATSVSNSAYNQTSVFNPAPGGTNYPTTIGYATGGGSTSFTETNSGSSGWGGIAVPVQ